MLDAHPGFGSLDGFENLVPGTHSSTSIEHVPVIDENERDPGLVPRVSPVQRIPQRGNENEAVEEDKRGHVLEQLSHVESPARTPQTGDEDIADAQSLSTVGKQSSPGSLTFWPQFFSYQLTVIFLCC